MNPDIIELILRWVEALVEYELEVRGNTYHSVGHRHRLRNIRDDLRKQIESALERGGYVPIK